MDSRNIENNSEGEEDNKSEILPTDGYFPTSSSHATSRIPDVFVPDPSLELEIGREETGGKSKAREVDEERARHFNQSQAPALVSSHHSRHCQTYNQTFTYSQSLSSPDSPPQTSSRNGVCPDAPPAYTPISTHRQDQQKNCKTFSNSSSIIMGPTPGGEGESLLGSQPESMGAPVDKGNNYPLRTARAGRLRLPAWFSWKEALLALVVLIVSLAFLAGVTSPHHSSGGDSDITLPPNMPIEKEPQGQVPGDTSESPFQSTHCTGEYYSSEVMPLNFEKSQSLLFHETIGSPSGSDHVRISGQVEVRGLKEGEDPRMTLEIITNEPDLKASTTLDAKRQRIRIEVPDRFVSSIGGRAPCLAIRGTIWVPSAGELSELAVRVTHLDILLFDDLSLHVAKSIDLTSVVGKINSGTHTDSKYTPAKETYNLTSKFFHARTTSGSITGTWPLYNRIHLHSISGNINISITPKEEDPNNPQPAELILATISGSITAYEPDESSLIPRRSDYLVEVKSSSGGIRGALGFGSACALKSISGNVEMDLLPVINLANHDEESISPWDLETETASGNTSIRVVEPIYFTTSTTRSKSRTLDNLTATHISTSGNITIQYPQSWEGILYAETTTGNVVARGKDLKIVRRVDGRPGSELEARKGSIPDDDGEGKMSTIRVLAVSGDVRALIGDER